MSRWDTYQPFDPVPPTGDTIMEESWLLCLDEFMVRKTNPYPDTDPQTWLNPDPVSKHCFPGRARSIPVLIYNSFYSTNLLPAAILVTKVNIITKNRIRSYIQLRASFLAVILIISSITEVSGPLWRLLCLDEFMVRTTFQHFPAVLRIRNRTDPHLFWSAGSGSAVGIRIRIQEGQNEAQKWRKLKFWSARCSLLRDEDLSCSLDVLYGGLRISKLQFLIKKI